MLSQLFLNHARHVIETFTKIPPSIFPHVVEMKFSVSGYSQYYALPFCFGTNEVAKTCWPLNLDSISVFQIAKSPFTTARRISAAFTDLPDRMMELNGFSPCRKGTIPAKLARFIPNEIGPCQMGSVHVGMGLVQS